MMVRVMQGWIPACLMACVLGFALSLAVERLLRPSPRLCGRPWRAWLLHAGVWLVLFALEMALFGRPFNAAANVVALQLLFTLISNAKNASLREPFVFQDFDYCVDVFRHPRLYLPFLGLWRGLLGASAICACVYAGLRLETSLWTSFFSLTPVFFATILLASGGLLLLAGSLKPLEITCVPADDLYRLGFFAVLWTYMLAERRPIDIGQIRSPLLMPVIRNAAELPDIVVVQSESFFDIRRVVPGIRRGILAEFDRLREESLCHGQLDVPAWGANTVRSEFAFLSGMPQDALGVHRFNPYRKLARQNIVTIASLLRSAGYRTICVHPYPASFYHRDIVIPRLGFDEFLDISAFEGAPRFGPYVSDEAVTDRILSLVKGQGQPVLVFAITMENHGPLHWEKAQPSEVEASFDEPPSQELNELTVYLRHLANADRMMGRIRDHLQQSGRPSLFGWFGDHRPILNVLSCGSAGEDNSSDYFIWAGRGEGEGAEVAHLPLDKLAGRLLQQFGRIAG